MRYSIASLILVLGCGGSPTAKAPAPKGAVKVAEPSHHECALTTASTEQFWTPVMIGRVAIASSISGSAEVVVRSDRDRGALEVRGRGLTIRAEAEIESVVFHDSPENLYRGVYRPPVLKLRSVDEATLVGEFEVADGLHFAEPGPLELSVRCADGRFGVPPDDEIEERETSVPLATDELEFRAEPNGPTVVTLLSDGNEQVYVLERRGDVALVEFDFEAGEFVRGWVDSSSLAPPLAYGSLFGIGGGGQPKVKVDVFSCSNRVPVEVEIYRERFLAGELEPGTAVALDESGEILGIGDAENAGAQFTQPLSVDSLFPLRLRPDDLSHCRKIDTWEISPAS